MENSMKQANENYQDWKDRHDVDRAFEIWEDGVLYFRHAFKRFYTEEQVKAFAVYFAEKVKGAKL